MTTAERTRIDLYRGCIWIEFEGSLANVFFKGLDDEIVVCQFPLSEFVNAMRTLSQEKTVILESGPSWLRIRLCQGWVDITIAHKTFGSIIMNFKSFPEELLSL